MTFSDRLRNDCPLIKNDPEVGRSGMPADLIRIIDTLNKAVSELEVGIGLIKGFKYPVKLREIIQRISEYENEADLIFAHAGTDLFGVVP